MSKCSSMIFVISDIFWNDIMRVCVHLYVSDSRFLGLLIAWRFIHATVLFLQGAYFESHYMSCFIPAKCTLWVMHVLFYCQRCNFSSRNSRNTTGFRHGTSVYWQSVFVPFRLSVMPANWDLLHPLIAEIIFRVHGLLSGGTIVAFMWVPSHNGLAGNLAVDIAAKAVLFLPVSNFTVPHLDYNSLICTL